MTSVRGDHHVQLFDSFLARREAAAPRQAAVGEVAGGAGHRSWGGGGLRQAGLLRRDGRRVAPVRPGDGGRPDPRGSADDGGRRRRQAAVVCAEGGAVAPRWLRRRALLVAAGEAGQDLGDRAAGHLLDWAGLFFWTGGGLRGGQGLRIRISRSLELVPGGVEALVDPGLVGGVVVSTGAHAAGRTLAQDGGGAGGRGGQRGRDPWTRTAVASILRANFLRDVVGPVVTVCLL